MDGSNHISKSQIEDLGEIENQQDVNFESDNYLNSQKNAIHAWTRASRITKSFVGSFIVTEKKCGTLPAIFNVMNTTMGCGILSLPLVLSKFGFVIGLLSIILAYFLVILTCKLLIKSKNLARQADYGKIGIICFKKAGEIIIKIMIIVDTFGMVVSYVIIFGTAVDKIIEKADQNVQGSRPFYENRKLYQIIACFLIIPFVYAKSTERLKFASYICFLSILIYAFVTMYNMAQRFKQGNTGDFEWVPGSNFDFYQALSSFCNIFVAFTFQFNFYPIYKDLKVRTDENMMKIIYWSQSLVMILYLESAICGYLAFGNSISTANIIENFTEDDIGIVLYYMVFISFSFVCITSVPANFFESRNQLLSFYCEIVEYFKKDKSQAEFPESIDQQQSSLLSEGNAIKTVSSAPQPSFKLFIIFSTIYYAGVIAFGMFITNINTVLAIVGAIAANSIVYIFPAFFFCKLIRMKGKEKDKWYNIGIGILVFGFICMFASLGGTIYGFTQ
eukprot:TRINITY_DN1823_c0_g1_i2.p1 TRINITY_DN1823_c0_g1~~TRINITY_DN1823_c0_g1_i2.p1  ORF type:complete len:503 (-),score=41.08 TRINITY_DN1823_c0_g1_i2:91-1599(-)